MCTALVVGNIIGIGIFVMPAALAPYGLNALTAWAITVVGCLFLALTFASLARTFPHDDGPYAYTRRAFGEPTAFIAMWCYWISTWVTTPWGRARAAKASMNASVSRIMKQLPPAFFTA